MATYSIKAVQSALDSSMDIDKVLTVQLNAAYKLGQTGSVDAMVEIMETVRSTKYSKSNYASLAGQWLFAAGLRFDDENWWVNTCDKPADFKVWLHTRNEKRKAKKAEDANKDVVDVFTTRSVSLGKSAAQAFITKGTKKPTQAQYAAYVKKITKALEAEMLSVYNNTNA